MQSALVPSITRILAGMSCASSAPPNKELIYCASFAMGFVGLILVIFNNRRKKLAIALVTGATYSQLYCEIIAEIETVILTGSILGEIIGILVLNIANGSITYFEFGTDITLAILLPVIYIAIGLIISFAALYKLINIKPNEILKKE